MRWGYATEDERSQAGLSIKWDLINTVETETKQEDDKTCQF